MSTVLNRSDIQRGQTSIKVSSKLSSAEGLSDDQIFSMWRVSATKNNNNLKHEAFEGTVLSAISMSFEITNHHKSSQIYTPVIHYEAPTGTRNQALPSSK